MTESIHLDHVALASRHAWDNVVRYGHHMGARWMGGTNDYATEEYDFYFAQMEFASGTKLEFLEPLEVEGSEFIRRFLHRNGPGPHHLTFKVPDLDDAISTIESHGYSLVAINREDEGWQEAFLHPKQSHGIVIQLACQGQDREEWITPDALPPALQPLPSLDKVVHLVADLDAATSLFSGPLEMAVTGSGESSLGEFRHLTDGPWLLELVTPTPGSPAHHWMGNRAGRMLQLCIAVADPGAVPDVSSLGDGRYELRPEVNQGTRVILEASR